MIDEKPSKRTKPSPVRGLGSGILAAVTALLVYSSLAISPLQSQEMLSSGGLGLSRVVWESRHGKPDSKCLIGDCYQNGKYMALFNEDDRIWMLRRQWNGSVSTSRSQSEGENLAPEDRRYLKDIRSSSGSPGKLYYSESLKQALPSGPWIGGNPGEFIILHSTGGGKTIHETVLGIGNNP